MIAARFSFKTLVSKWNLGPMGLLPMALLIQGVHPPEDWDEEEEEPEF